MSSAVSQKADSNTISQSDKMMMKPMDTKMNDTKRPILFKFNLSFQNCYKNWYSIRKFGYPLNIQSIKNVKTKPVGIPSIDYWNHQWQIEDYT